MAASGLVYSENSTVREASRFILASSSLFKGPDIGKTG